MTSPVASPRYGSRREQDGKGIELTPDPAEGAYSAPQAPAVFKGAYCLGREGDEGGEGMERVGKENRRGREGRERREGEGQALKYLAYN